MSAKFEFFEAPESKLTDKRPLHARIVGGRTVELKELAEIIQSKCTVTPTDTIAVLTALSDAMIQILGKGDRLHMEELGYFYPTLTCKESADGKEPDKCNVTLKSIRFVPEAQLTQRLARQMKLQPSDREDHHSTTYTDEEINALLARFFEKDQFLTRRKFEELCGVKRGVALKWIEKLVKDGRLKNVGSKFQPMYVEGNSFIANCKIQ